MADSSAILAVKLRTRYLTDTLSMAQNREKFVALMERYCGTYPLAREFKNFRMMNSTRRRDTTLDGLRGVAILVVIVHHIRVSFGFGPSVWFPFTGIDGVCLFFVISGYLITTLMLKERAKFGDLSLSRFWLRRVLRIFPAFYAFILAMVAVRALGWVSFNNRDLIVSSAYLRNLIYTPDTVMQHTWSLATEEQYYLLFPLVVAFLRPRWLVILCTAVLLGKMILVAIVRGAYADGTAALNSVGLESILAGSLLAIAAARNPDLKKNVHWSQALAFIVMLALLHIMSSKIHGFSALLIQLLRTCTILCAFYCALHSNLSFLRNRALVWIGLISYSLYLWQQPFIVTAGATLGSMCWRIAAAMACASCSYYLIEKPCGRLKERFSRVELAGESIAQKIPA